MGTDAMMKRQSVRSRDTLNVEGMAQLNYEVLHQKTLDELRHSLETPCKTRIRQEHKIIRKSKQYKLRTQPAHKDYQLVSDKQVLQQDVDAANAHLLSKLLSRQEQGVARGSKKKKLSSAIMELR